MVSFTFRLLFSPRQRPQRPSTSYRSELQKQSGSFGEEKNLFFSDGNRTTIFRSSFRCLFAKTAELTGLTFVFMLISHSVLRQVQSHFQSGFSTEGDLVLPLSIYSSLSFLSIFQWLLASSSSSSRHLYLSICLSFNNVIQKAVFTHNVTNPVSLPSFTVTEMSLSFLILCNTS